MKAKTCFLLLALAFVGSAVWAVPADESVRPDAWIANPLDWKIDGDALVFDGAGPSDAFVPLPRGREVSISLDVRPDVSEPVPGMPLAVAIDDGNGDFWQLALVNDKRGRRFDFGEMSAWKWHAQIAEGLTRLPDSSVAGSWISGEEYVLSLSLTAGTIIGEARNAAGDLLYRCGYSLKGVTVMSGVPALRVQRGVRVRVKGVKASASGIPPPRRKVAYPPYAGITPNLAEPRERATGFFRVWQKPDGSWRMVDPNGCPYRSFGIDFACYGGGPSQGKSAYLAWNERHYPSRSAWDDETLSRLKAWGFNALVFGDAGLRRRGLAHVTGLAIGTRLCRKSLPEEFRICAHNGGSCTAFPNVFHPRFRTWCEHIAHAECAPHRDDPWLLGYYVDNEMAWWGRADFGSGTGLYDAVLKLADGHPAKAALVAAAEKAKVDPLAAPDEVKIGFLRTAARKFFSETTRAIRREDPNHLILGVRFAGVTGTHPVVWEESAKWCDVVSCNIYPEVDLATETVGLCYKPLDTRPLRPALDARQKLTGKPVIVSEWCFSALDSSLPCERGGGQRFATQQERAKAAGIFMREIFGYGYVIGADFFMWTDETAESVRNAASENANTGLVNSRGEPYPIVETLSKFHCNK